MSKESGVIVLGILVAVMPLLGFPQSWRDAFFIIAGLCLALLGFFLRADHLHEAALPSSTPASRARRGKARPSPYLDEVHPKKIDDISPASPEEDSHDEDSRKV